MSIDKKIIEEISRYNKINNYILEQEAGELPPEGKLFIKVEGIEEPALRSVPTLVVKNGRRHG